MVVRKELMAWRILVMVDEPVNSLDSKILTGCASSQISCSHSGVEWEYGFGTKMQIGDTVVEQGGGSVLTLLVSE